MIYDIIDTRWAGGGRVRDRARSLQPTPTKVVNYMKLFNYVDGQNLLAYQQMALYRRGDLK